MKTDAYLITCLTNMHVGSGEANYGVVDNLVQRDPISEIPIINSSSLKGALREFFSDVWKSESDKLNYVFGPDALRSKGAESGIGHYKFFDANLIILPVRSNMKPFYRATSDNVMKEINNRAKALGLENFNINPFNPVSALEGKPKVADNGKPMLEDYQAENGLILKNNNHNLGDDLALFYDDDFKDLVKHLPVIARNNLENGQSQNLWYEEVVPRESRFVFFVSKTEDNDKVKQKDFDDAFENKLIQIGGNASIGYGYTKIIKLS